jgi:hypothetical protein
MEKVRVEMREVKRVGRRRRRWEWMWGIEEVKGLGMVVDGWRQNFGL